MSSTGEQSQLGSTGERYCGPRAVQGGVTGVDSARVPEIGGGGEEYRVAG